MCLLPKGGSFLCVKCYTATIFVKIYKNIFKKPLDIIHFNDIIDIDKVYAWDNCIYFSLA